jgi:hypothetical protein
MAAWTAEHLLALQSDLEHGGNSFLGNGTARNHIPECGTSHTQWSQSLSQQLEVGSLSS